MPPMVRVQNLGKHFRVNRSEPRGQSGYRTLRDDLVRLASAPLRPWRNGGSSSRLEDFWALQDVSFEVQEGEVVGIIGRNGAGKSTLLKILSRITKPSRGSVELWGRIGCLLEVGTGFHPELTGRENIFLNGAILGMSRTEIARKFEEIVEFAEIQQFLETPVKRYSSGMYVRLAFAVAAHLEPEILVVDEVLAVGDVSFQRKCLGKMQSLSEGGRTVLFVSHNMPAVRSITQTCLYLKDGQVVCGGATAEIIDRYLQDAWENRRLGSDANLDYYRRDKLRNPPVSIRRLWVSGETGGDPLVLRSGEDFTVHCEIAAERTYPRAYLTFWVTNPQGERVATFFSADQKFELALTRGVQTIACRIRALPLSPGRYSITVGINEGIKTMAFDVIVDYPAFQVVMPEVESGELEWSSRPWGCFHWEDVRWSLAAGEAREAI